MQQVGLAGPVPEGGATREGEAVGRPQGVVAPGLGLQVGTPQRDDGAVQGLGPEEPVKVLVPGPVAVAAGPGRQVSDGLYHRPEVMIVAVAQREDQRPVVLPIVRDAAGLCVLELKEGVSGPPHPLLQPSARGRPWRSPRRMAQR